MAGELQPHLLSRRAVLVSAAAGGAALLIGFARCSRRAGVSPDTVEAGFAPNLWIRIGVDGSVAITVQKCEMGQGVLTALPMLIAEELEIDLHALRIEQADADFRFSDQNTSGSSSIIDTWDSLRRAGAVARIALVRAAAHEWGVAESECRAENGSVRHPASDRSAPYGALIATAAQLPLPEPGDVDLKPYWSFKLIGTPNAQLDLADRVSGQQVYGLDVRVPGMLYATVLRCPVVNARATTVDPATAATLPGVRVISAAVEAARALPGVRDVLLLDEDVPARLPPRVAIVATSTWAAFQASRQIEVHWDHGPAAQWSSDEIGRRLRAWDAIEPIVVRDSGGALTSAPGAGSTLTAEYEVPFMAHVPMEPINCTAHFQGDSLEIWAPTQFPQRAVDHAARIAGLSREQVRLHVIPMGGAFGRRASPDFVVEAVQISRAVSAPVKVTWTREQDIRQDFFRPASLQRLTATLDGQGRVRSWLHQMAGPSIIRQIFPPGVFPIEGNEIDGAVNLPYGIAHVRVEWRHVDLPVALGVWRSVAQSQNVFAVESFIDELAAAGGRDPVEYRRALLDGDPRLRNVLDLASRAAGWGTRLRSNEGRGVALNRYGEGTFIAVIATVAVAPAGALRVERLTCAVDCGQIVNPLSLRAQIEGGLVWGLSATLHGRITIKGGRIEQSNFHDFPILRINECPQLDVHLVESHAQPGGIGEPCAPPVAPAVANALFAAKGIRIRSLPLPETVMSGSARFEPAARHPNRREGC